MASPKNYFELLELNDPPFTDLAVIDKAIADKAKQWGSDAHLATGAQQARARENHQLLDDIRAVMRSDSAQRRKMLKEWQDILQTRRNALEQTLMSRYQVLAESGYLLEQDYQDLVKDFTEALVKRVVKVPVTAAPPEQKKHFMDPVRFRELAEWLEHLGKRDLYDLLEKPRATSTADLLKCAADNRRVTIKRAGQNNPNNDLAKQVFDKCLVIFKNDAERAQYDNALDRFPIQKLLEPDARQILKNRGRLEPAQVKALVRQAVQKGISEAQATEYLQSLQDQYAGKAQGPPQKCPKCTHENDSRSEACAKCGTVLLVDCPKCGLKKPVTNAACTKCAFTEKDGEKFRALLVQARDNLNPGSFSQARDVLLEARRLLPDSQEVRQLGEDVDSAELAALVKTIRADLDNGRLVDAEEGLDRASRIRPDDAAVADMRRKLAGRKSLAALEEAIQDGRSERRILQAWEALTAAGLEGDAASHRKRVELAECRVKALAHVLPGEDFQTDTQLVNDLGPLVETQGPGSLRLESCHDPDVLELVERLKGAKRRLKDVDEFRTNLNEADQGRVTESQLAQRGRTLKPDYYPELFSRLQLAVELTAQPRNHAEIAKLWELASRTEFCPKHAETLDQCQRIAKAELARNIVNELTAKTSEENDDKFVRAFETHELGRGDTDGRLTRRYQESQERLSRLETIEQAVDAADAGKPGDQPEWGVVSAADGAGLPPEYAYRLKRRVALARAISESPRSDRRVAQAADELKADGPWPRWPQTLSLLETPARRTERLDQIVTLSPSLSREGRDAELVRLWNDDLRECADARVYLPEFQEAEVRQKTWKRIADLLEQGGDPRGVDRWRDRVKDYEVYAERQADIEALVARAKRVAPLLDALDEHDDQAFAQAFDPKVMQQDAAAFQDYWPEIERIVRESMSDVLKAVPANPAWSWDHDRKSVRIHWSVRPREHTSLSAVATSSDRFYATVAEAEGRLREVNATAVRGFSVRAPSRGEQLFVTVWPLLLIGNVRLYGPAASIGPIDSSSGLAAANGSVETFRWNQIPRRMMRWLAGVAKRI